MTENYFGILRIVIPFTLLLGMSLACGIPAPRPADVTITPEIPISTLPKPEFYNPNVNTYLLSTRIPGSQIFTPTPDIMHPVPTLRTEPIKYFVQPGDTLKGIASRFGVGMEQIVAANQLNNPDLISISQELVIPAPQPIPIAPGFKIIPDSELVNGPVSAYFDYTAFVYASGGYLGTYSEKVEGIQLSGVEIIDQISRNYSINPRLLLSVLEYQSGWVTQKNPSIDTLQYPIQAGVDWRKGLYSQFSWAADNLNLGYYLWQVNGLPGLALPNGNIIPANPTVNAGTAAVQYLAGLMYPYEKWLHAVSVEGIQATYMELFGYPFDYAIQPTLAQNVLQPPLQFPFEKDIVWSFTGGPHGGWGDGSAWAALDFAPPGDQPGCVLSDAWVTAVADSHVTRAENGIVVLDLDDDGFEQTGWSIFYLHIATRDRASLGADLHAGDRIGHASCEGGNSTGTHIHIARRYNGEWVSADGSVPFVLDGWVSRGAGSIYNGFLENDDQIVEAWDERRDENQIQR